MDKKVFDYIGLILKLLRNFPSIVLDSREVNVPAGATVKRKRPYNTITGDFEVTISVSNKLTVDKQYKVITFITDL